MSTTPSKIALKGSAKVVSDYFEYSINSLLYQRGIYAPEDFQMVRKYGLNVMLTIDEDVKEYIAQIMAQLRKWVYGGKITKLVVPIISKESDEVVERWEFQLEPEEESANEHSDQDIQKQIQAIVRQITASVTFLPQLEGQHTFSVLVYTLPTDLKIPNKWVDTHGDGKEIDMDVAEAIKFRSFTTGRHKVGTFVSYKMG